jgi:hypothetical protein
LLRLSELRDDIYNSDLFLEMFLRNDIQQAEKLNIVLKSELAKRPDTYAIAMFGHRHKRSLSRLGNVFYEEAPNVATDNPDDFGYYAVDPSVTPPSISWCPIGRPE